MPVTVFQNLKNDSCMEMNKEYKTQPAEPSLFAMFALLAGLSLVVGVVVSLVFTVSQVFK